MDELLNEIRVAYPDTVINSILAAIPEDVHDTPISLHYSHSEELFLQLGTELAVPRFPIHHDIHVDVPSAIYAYALKELVLQLVELLPNVLRGLTYFFDPTEPLKAHFYRLYKVDNSTYLFLLRIDLVFRPFQGDVLQAGTNDETPAFRTDRLFVESEFIPLDAVMWELGKARAFRVKQMVSNTWIGETGRGYLVHGIWMDNDLTKFFSRIVLPPGARTYPFYPLFCKYKTICAAGLPPDSERRKAALPLLHRSIGLLLPKMSEIQDSLREAGGALETMPIFVELRGDVPSSWRTHLEGVVVRSYLNSQDMKEYLLEIDDQ